MAGYLKKYYRNLRNESDLKGLVEKIKTHVENKKKAVAQAAQAAQIPHKDTFEELKKALEKNEVNCEVSESKKKFLEELQKGFFTPAPKEEMKTNKGYQPPASNLVKRPNFELNK